MLKRTSLSHFIALCCAALPSIVMASSFQRFAGFAFDNPARLSLVKNKQILAEGYYSSLKTRFSGTSRGGSGIANGEGNTWPFYLRYAQRIAAPVVVGLDITTPYMAKTAYSHDSIVRFASTYSYVNSVDVSPNIAYTPLKWLALGFGLDIMYLGFDIQNMVTTAAGPQLVTSNSSGKKTGWHAGVAAVLNPNTSVGFTYYAPITNFTTSGDSSRPGVTTRWMVKGINLPATYILGASQKITPAWTIIGLASYTVWSINTLHYINTAVGNINPVFNFTNTWRFLVLNNYIFNPMFSGKFGVSYDQGPTNDVNRGIGVPTDNALALIFGGGYQINKAINAELNYAHVFFVKTRLRNVPTATFGTLASHADSIGMKVTWNL